MQKKKQKKVYYTEFKIIQTIQHNYHPKSLTKKENYYPRSKKRKQHKFQHY